MISRIVTRSLLPLAQRSLATPYVLYTPRFNFARAPRIPTLKDAVESELKAQSESPVDLTNFLDTFKNGGWQIAEKDTTVELSKTIGAFQVRLLSNIKAPTNFDNQEGEQQQQQQENQEGDDQYNGDVSEVTICVTKTGAQKTLMINTVVSQGFEIASISFASNYEEAKKARLDVFTSNVYSGPEMETLSQELHESFYGFIEKELGITDSLLEDFTDYCMDKEQHFYIEWLKDLKSVI